MSDPISRLAGDNGKLIVYENYVMFKGRQISLNKIERVDLVRKTDLGNGYISLTLAESYKELRFFFPDTEKKWEVAERLVVNLESMLSEGREAVASGTPAEHPKKKSRTGFIIPLSVSIIAISLIILIVTGVNDDSILVDTQLPTGNSTSASAGSVAEYAPVNNYESGDTIFERDNSSAKLTKIYTGVYFVDDDLPPGRYVITGEGSGNLFIYSADGTTMVNEILDDGENEYSSGSSVPSVTCNLALGDTIEVSGLNSVTCKPAETKISSNLGAGYWLVGLDIAANSYDAKAKDGTSGNFVVYSEYGDLKVNEILGDSDYGVSTVRVHLEDGDVIYISGMPRVGFSRAK